MGLVFGQNLVIHHNVKAEVNSSVTYSFDQKKHQIVALLNKPTDQ